MASADENDAELAKLLSKINDQLHDMKPPRPVHSGGDRAGLGSVSSRNSGSSSFLADADAAQPLRLFDSLIASRKATYDHSTAASRERARSSSQQRQRISSQTSHVVAELASDMAHSPQQIRRRSLASSKIVRHTQPINDHLVVTHASGRTAPPRATRSNSRRSSVAPVAERRTHSRASSRASTHRGEPDCKIVEIPVKVDTSVERKATSQRLFHRSQHEAKRALETHEAQIAALMHTMRHLPSAFRQAMLSSHTPGSSSYAVVAAAVARVEEEHDGLQALARRRVMLGPLQPQQSTEHHLQEQKAAIHVHPAAQAATGRPVQATVARQPPPSEGSAPPSSPPLSARERHHARRPSTSSAITRASVASDGPTPRHADSLHTHVHRMADAAVSKASAAVPTWVTGSNWTPAVTAPQPFQLSTTNKRRPVVRPAQAKRTSSAALNRLYQGKSSVPLSVTKHVRGAFPSPAAARELAQERSARTRTGSATSASTRELSTPAKHIRVPSTDAAPMDAVPPLSWAGPPAAPSLESSLSSVPSFYGLEGSAHDLSIPDAFQAAQPSALAAAALDASRNNEVPHEEAQVADARPAEGFSRLPLSVASDSTRGPDEQSREPVSPQSAPQQEITPVSVDTGASSVLDDILSSAIFAM